MRTRVATLAFMVIACSRTTSPPSTADSTAAVQHADDSIVALRTQEAPAFADTARSTMAVLLKHPETATFDSLVVVQPQKANGSWPAPFACGRIGGKPGIGGKNTMTPFIFGNRLALFVLDEHNGAAFAALRAKDCEAIGARVLLR